MSDNANCGACGYQCPESQIVCENALCHPWQGQPLQPCPSNQVVCGGACTDLLHDGAHCGACDHQCPEYASACYDGLCGVPGQGPLAQPCPADQTRCNDACVNLLLDNAHCGACGHQCAEGHACADGLCR
jgi:hypothetical protein